MRREESGLIESAISHAFFASVAGAALALASVAPASAAVEMHSAPGRSGVQLPAYPQNFDVQGPMTASFGFAVTQPGPVRVSVQSQGAPVIVILRGSASKPIRQQGAGRVQLAYDVTPQDVQKSALWDVQIRLAQPAPSQKAARATGTVNIAYPPVDQAALQRSVEATAARRRQPSEQEQQQALAQVTARSQAAFQQQRAHFDQQQSGRRAALHAQIKPQVDQLRSRAGAQVSTRGLRGEQATKALEQPLDTATPQRTAQPIPPAEPPTATSSQALQGAGTTAGPQTVMPNPGIAALSVTQGQPGDPVLISGGGFGNGGGEVRFVVGPGKELIASTGVIWQDNQIFASVPDATGLAAFNGTLYVKRAADKMNSNLVPFRFNPLSEIRQITKISDISFQQFNGVNVFNGGGFYVRRMHSFLFWSPQGNDQIFMNTRLKNGWIVSQQPVVSMPYPSATDGGVLLADGHVGTNWPHMNVRFWMDTWWSNMSKGGMSPTLDYAISIVIQGPKGLPDGVVVP